MTIDEAIEVLGGLVSQAGGEGDDALDVVKDAAHALGQIRKTWDSATFPIRCPSPEYKRIQDVLREVED